MNKKIIQLGLALMLGLSVTAASAQVRIEGTVGGGRYVIESGREIEEYRGHEYWRGQRLIFDSRRQCERSMNYDRGHDNRRARYGDRLVQCERVYVRSTCYNYSRQNARCYLVKWTPEWAAYQRW